MACASDSSQAQLPAWGTALAATELMLLVLLWDWGSKNPHPSIIHFSLADLYSFVLSVKGGLGHHIPGVGMKWLCLPRAGSSRCRARMVQVYPWGEWVGKVFCTNGGDPSQLVLGHHPPWMGEPHSKSSTAGWCPGGIVQGSRGSWQPRWCTWHSAPSCLPSPGVLSLVQG